MYDLLVFQTHGFVSKQWEKMPTQHRNDIHRILVMGEVNPSNIWASLGSSMWRNLQGIEMEDVDGIDCWRMCLDLILCKFPNRLLQIDTLHFMMTKGFMEVGF